jgi:hypothetical protein
MVELSFAKKVNFRRESLAFGIAYSARNGYRLGPVIAAKDQKTLDKVAGIIN